MTRNDSDPDGIWMTTEGGSSKRNHRQPTNWPTAALGIAALAAIAFVAWLCAGVAAEWISE